MSTDLKFLRDETFKRLDGMSGFSAFRKLALRTLQPESLPCLSVYMGPERRESAGDSGPPQFHCEGTIMISGVGQAADDDDDTDAELDAAMDRVETLLLRDPRWVMLSQRVLRVSRTSNFSRPGQSEVLTAEIRLEIVLSYFQIWEPIINDNLERIRVDTRFPPGGTDEEVAAVQQVGALYELEPES